MSLVSNNTIECLWTTSNNKNQRKLILCVVYRPPLGGIKEFISYLKDTLQEIDPKSNHELFIFGDFNIDYNMHQSPARRDLKEFEVLYNLK